MRTVIHSTARRYQRCEDSQPPLHEVAVGSTTGTSHATTSETLTSTVVALATAYVAEIAAIAAP